MRTALVILAWTSMLLPWQRCHAPCHDRVELGEHDCHPEGCCPEKPGEGSRTTSDEPLGFDSVRPSPEPAAAPPSFTVPFAVAVAPAPRLVAPAQEPPTAVPRTTVLLL